MLPGWDPRAERSACGIGFVADASGRGRRRVLDAALEALARMAHRGAIGADGKSTDGAGVLIPLPEALLAGAVGGPSRLAALGDGRLGVAALFGRGPWGALDDAVARACEAEGLALLGWRDVPFDAGCLGPAARGCAPSVRHAVVWFPADVDDLRAGHRARRRVARAVDEAGLDATVVSFGARTVTYKGLVAGARLADLYPDLRDPRVAPWFAIVHQRFSTNTEPSWERAQPFRTLAHNGEINTLRGNVEAMRAREGSLGLGDPAAEALLTPILDEGGSDSSMLDEALELLVSEGDGGGLDVRAAVTALVPPAWERDPRIGERRRAMHRWFETRIEPWDGPAAFVFTDGRVVGAALDRNGLRPLRWSAGDDGLVAVASESGVVDHEGGARHGRLGPGEMLAVDPAGGGLRLDPLELAAAAAPYGAWGARERVRWVPAGGGDGPATAGDGARDRDGVGDRGDLLQRQVAHGCSREDVGLLLRPMAADGHEPTFSMGDDTPIPPLASRPRPVPAFLRQRFAQVTNPAIDHLREGWVMSMRTFLGPAPPLLARGPAASALVELPTFLVEEAPDGPALDATWPTAEGPDGLARALARLADRACAVAADGRWPLVVTNEAIDPAHAPVPSVLAVGAIHTALVGAGLRRPTSIVADVDDAWSSHDAACLLAVGVDAIRPGLALETVADLHGQGRLRGVEAAEARRRYLTAVEAGVRKAMARLGISVVASYRGARALDALGLADEVVARCFPGVVSPIGGLGFADLGAHALERHREAYGHAPALANDGVVKHRNGGEYHATNPDVVRAIHRSVDPGLARLRSTAAGPSAGAGGAEAGASRERIDAAAAHALRRAVADGDADAYARFAALVEDRPPTAPRDLLAIRPAGPPVDVDEVEDASAILARASTAAISHGAISSEAHETLAAGAALAGARANSGEGGEDPSRYGTPRGTAIKQVASGRFGVTPAYLASADELQIKIAQGSKPGEGGQLPGAKVTAEIAALRHAQPGVALLSPAPHHDIYSIEDLAQLVYDLKQANPRAAVSVKLVAEAGVGTVAAGVAKALADVIHVSGADGGTGASPLASIKHAGMPWEVGLAEVRRALAAQGLRDRVRLRVDGGLRTGRDVVLAALLGADEWSFGTAALVAEGCLMVRSCHLDTCPVGIATQRPELRARFAATPRMVATYLRMVAEDARRILASLGLRSIEEAVGRADLLEQVRRDGGLTLDGLLAPEAERRFVAHVAAQRHRSTLGDRVADLAAPVVASGGAATASFPIGTGDRAVGAALGGRLAAGRGAGGRPGHVAYGFEGAAGQSFGAFLVDGVELRLVGTANDGVGKGIAGGRVVVVPPRRAAADPALVGNAALYGATGGELFVAGTAGERFAVRNAGADAVVEGVGANACEYMTGGAVAIVGPVGPNLGAGMTGGRAFVLDPDGRVDALAHDDAALGGPPEGDDARDLLRLLRAHVRHTGSARAAALLADPAACVAAFRTVRPRALGVVAVDADVDAVVALDTVDTALDAVAAGALGG